MFLQIQKPLKRMLRTRRKNMKFHLIKKIILSVSRLHAQKGLKYLIEAMETIARKYSDAFLVIVGEGEERKKLEKLVKEKGLESKVRYTGLVDDWDKQTLIKGCDVYCMSSIEEAFGIALFDPMYYSKPIVATKVGGVPELLGDSNILVQKENPDALSEAIIKLLNSNTQEGQKGHDRLKHFYPDVILVDMKRYWGAPHILQTFK